jgi:hypothetical protein
VLELPEGLEPEALLARLRGLAAVRCKGFAATRDGVRVIQGVGSRIELREPERAPPPELIGKLVVIRRRA